MPLLAYKIGNTRSRDNTKDLNFSGSRVGIVYAGNNTLWFVNNSTNICTKLITANNNMPEIVHKDITFRIW